MTTYPVPATPLWTLVSFALNYGTNSTYWLNPFTDLLNQVTNNI